MKIESIQVLAKLDDGTIRQIFLNKESLDLLLNIIPGLYEDKTIKISETRLDNYISWETP